MAVVDVVRQGGVVTVTLNRPEAKNALNPEMVVRLVGVWEDVAKDQDVRAVVLTGAAGSTFCAGADLGTLSPLQTGARDPIDEWDRAVLDDLTLPGRSVLVGVDLGKPLIVAANGHAIAGGMLLLTAGDVRVVAAGARLALPELKLGLPGIGAVRLSRELPPALAREVFFTGNPISAERAFDVGFVNHVVPASEVLAIAEGLAQAIAASAPLAVQSTREVMRAAVGMSDADAIALERDRGAAVFASDDAREGPLAYIEKRAPVFKGS
jgi:enoyl-CoA hydratase